MDRLENDISAQRDQERMFLGAANYYMNKKTVTRPGGCVGTRGGLVCDYTTTGGPRTIEQDSYLTGRNLIAQFGEQPTVTPSPLFPARNPDGSLAGVAAMCPDQNMKPYDTRSPDVCNSMAEINISQSVFPEAFQRGYLGPMPLPGTSIQRAIGSKDGPYESRSLTAGGELLPAAPLINPNVKHRSYGTYGTGEAFVAYVD